MPWGVRPAYRTPATRPTGPLCALLTGSGSKKACTLTQVKQILDLSLSKCSQHLGTLGVEPPALHPQECCTNRVCGTMIPPTDDSTEISRPKPI